MGVGGAEDANGGGGTGGVAILQIADPVIASGRPPLPTDDIQDRDLSSKRPPNYRDAWAELNASLSTDKNSGKRAEGSRSSRRDTAMAEGERRRISRSGRGIDNDYDVDGGAGRSMNGVLRREKSPRPERPRRAIDDDGSWSKLGPDGEIGGRGARPATSGGRRMRRDNSGADELSTSGRLPDWAREPGSGASRPATSGGRRLRPSAHAGAGGDELVSPRMGGERPVGSPRSHMIPKSHSTTRGVGGSGRERLPSPLADDADEIMSPSKGRSVGRWVEDSIKEAPAGGGERERVPANMRFARRCRSVQVYNAADDPDSKINRSASSASEAKVALGGAAGSGGGGGASTSGGRPISPDRESMSSATSSVRRYHPKHGDDDNEDGERRPRRRAAADEDDLGRRLGSMRERGEGGFENTPRTPPPRMHSRSRYAEEGGPTRSPLRRRPGGERDPHRPPSRQSSHASDSGDPSSALFPRPPSRAGGEMPAPSPSGRLRSGAGRRGAGEHGEGGARPRTPTGMEMAGRMGFGDAVSRPKTADVHGRRSVPRSASTTEGTPLAGYAKERERGEKGVPRSASDLVDEEEEAGGYGGSRSGRYSGALRSRTVAEPEDGGEYDEEEEEELRMLEEKERRRRRAERARRMRAEAGEADGMEGDDGFDEEFDDEDGGGGGYGRMGTGGRGDREQRRAHRRREEDIMREEHRRLALELEREREERRKLAEELKRLERETKEREERRRMEKERRRAEKEKLVAEVAALKLPSGEADDGGTGEGRRTPRMGGGMLSPFGSARQKTPERERRGVGGHRPVTPERRPVTPEGMQARLTRKNREVIRAARKEAAAAEKGGEGGQTALQQVLVNILKRPFADVRESYKVDKSELGRGRFGVIRACVDRVTGEKLACKTISKGMLQCQQDIEDVRREVAVMEMLQGHPDVVNLRNTFEDAQDVHLVMELCEGGELFDRIKAKGKFSEKEAAKVLQTVIGVLQHCHELGVMHRDLKPENILLSSKESDVQLKVIDFGVATFFQRGKPCTDMAGSPYYLAPEVLAEKYGPEADIWSAGVVLYILLCGLPPFWGTTNEAIFEAIKEATLNLVRPPWPSISDDGKDLVRQMLNRNPKKRISIEEILEHPWIVTNAGPS